MKALKIVLVSLLVLLALLFAGGYFILRSVDINKYIPLVIREVKKNTGRDLSAGKAVLVPSLGGFTFEIKDLVLSDAPQFSEEPFMTAESLRLNVDLKALLLSRKVRADIKVAGLKLVIIRGKKGLTNVQAMAPEQLPASPSVAGKSVDQGASSGAAALGLISVDAFKVVSGEIRYIDETFSPALTIPIKNVRFLVRNFSVDKLFDFTLELSLFSAGDNVAVKGFSRLDPAASMFFLKDAEVAVDLDKIDLGAMADALPILRPAQLNVLKGQARALLPEVKAGPQGLEALKLHCTLLQGKVGSGQLPVPLQKISLQSQADIKEAMFELTADLAGGALAAKGKAEDYMSSLAVRFTFSGSDMDLGRFTAGYKLPVRITGLAAFEGSAGFSGTGPKEVMSSLHGQADVKLSGAKITGQSLLKTALSSIPMLPGVWEAVEPSLAQQARKEAEDGVTVIEECQADLRLQGMVLQVVKARLLTHEIELDASGTLDLPERVNMKADVLVLNELADVLVRKVNDLSGIRDDAGRLLLPVSISGPLAAPRISPDLDYLARKLLINKGLERVMTNNPQVRNVLDAIFSSGKPSSAGSQAEAAAPASEAPGGQNDLRPEKAVGDLLESIFQLKK
jgi:hypothetical protein